MMRGITDPKDPDYHKLTDDENRGIRWAAAFFQSEGVEVIEQQAPTWVQMLRDELGQNAGESGHQKYFAAGAIYALGIVAMQHGSDVEIRDAMREMDFLPNVDDHGGAYGSPWTRNQLVAAGADVYDAELVVACLEGRDPEEV